MAFMYPFYWAWMKGLIGLGWIHFAIMILLGWLILPLIIQMIYQGVKAGEHYGEFLKRYGYEEDGVVLTMSEFEAITKYNQQKNI